MFDYICKATTCSQPCFEQDHFFSGRLSAFSIVMLLFWLGDRHISGSAPPTSDLIRVGWRHKASHKYFTFRVQGSNPHGKNPWIRSPTTYPLGQRATHIEAYNNTHTTERNGENDERQNYRVKNKKCYITVSDIIRRSKPRMPHGWELWCAGVNN